ncbi:MAG: DUF2304 domain-containing protein [Deltaproteobacteria bacterium]|nr:DUF2304 domain-containing protein [Deltaproteobacteria bacterium]PWB67815.1 MAG: DUF2304 domain-containing protein [Deltaproteobacteria bacterium]
MSRVTFLSVCMSVALLFYILEMVRRRRLREEYSILWLCGSLVILILSVKREWLEGLSLAAGIAYPPSFLFLVGILFIILILIHFSIAISKLHQMNKKIAQELALMQQERSSPGGPAAAPDRDTPATDPGDALKQQG